MSASPPARRFRRCDRLIRAGRHCLGLIALIAGIAPAAAVVPAVVEIDFGLTSGGTDVEGFPVTVPGTDNEVTVTPSITFTAGGFRGSFVGTSPDGLVTDGPAGIEGLALEGTLAIRIDDTIQVGPFTIPVTATISGPVFASQATGSRGALAGLATYVEAVPGTYELEIGPLGCTDSALGVVCSSLAGALGIEFPLFQAVPAAPLPFLGGVFEDLNETGQATAFAELDLSIPLDPGGATAIPITASVSWTEVERRVAVIPEPDAGLLIAAAALALGPLRRRRPAAHRTCRGIE